MSEQSVSLAHPQQGSTGKSDYTQCDRGHATRGRGAQFPRYLAAL